MQKRLETCDSISEVLVVGFPQQPHQGRNSITVLNGNLVVGIFAIRDVLQRSTSCMMNLHQRQSLLSKCFAVMEHHLETTLGLYTVLLL